MARKSKEVSSPAEWVDERAQAFFKMLVEKYLRDGGPVASKTLSAQPGVDVSSATVRNIMAELEARGLVQSPHTSAGKVPTTVGLRFFVDSLLSVEPLDMRQVKQLESELNADLTPKELVDTASGLLSHLTQMTCLITLPQSEHVELRHVEFLPLPQDRVLVILVLNDREVQNRVIHTDREYSDIELNQAANFINQNYGGQTLQEIRAKIVDSMRTDKDRMDSLMQTALDIASRTFENNETPGKELVVAGETNLFNLSEDAEHVRTLFEAFSQKGSILHLLDRCLESGGVQLFIGDESGYQPMEDLSLVTSPYEANGEVAGVLGVVGPTRMAYQEVIPVVDVTARLLSAALKYA